MNSPKEDLVTILTDANAMQEQPPPAPNNSALRFFPLIDELQKFIASGDFAEARQLAGELRSSLKTSQPLEIVNAGDWLETEPPPADQIFTDFLDVGDKASLIASAKMRKSFVILQAAVCAATGVPFLGLQVPKPRRVLLIQMEIRPPHFHRRVLRMCRAMSADAALVKQNLRIINARGRQIDFDDISGIARKMNAEFIIFDPLYKLHDGDENLAKDIKPLLAKFDELAEDASAAVLYVHHDAKGIAGDRDIRDRGAGSNALARDYDACITLTAHAQAEDASVVAFLCRNYPPRENISSVWDEGCFRLSDLEPIAKTSTNKQTKQTSAAPAREYRSQALSVVAAKALISEDFHDALVTTVRLSDKKARTVTKILIEEKTLRKSVRLGYQGPVYIGTPEQIAKIENDYANPQLKSSITDGTPV